MRPFLTNHQLYITPLSPIHIGSGHEIDPTNYVVNDGFLYKLEPHLAVLNNRQRKEISVLAKKANLFQLHLFFKNNTEQFICTAHDIVPVCTGFEEEYQGIEKEVTKKEHADVFNRLYIRQHIYGGTKQLAYIPGSSFKGAVRTALFNELWLRSDSYNIKHESKRKAILNEVGRLFKVADFMPQKAPLTQILYSVLRYIRNPDTITSERLECLVMGQYRKFSASVSMLLFSSQPSVIPFFNKDGCFYLKDLAEYCNQFYLPILKDELKKGTEYLVDPNWYQSIKELISEQSSVKKKLDNNEAFLIRLGFNVGYRSVTLSEEARKNNSLNGTNKKVKTKKLAATKYRADKNFIPFGWAIVEIDPIEEEASLKKWCDQQKISGYCIDELSIILNEKKNNLKVQREQEVQRQRVALQEAKRRQEEIAQKAREEAQRLASLSENERKIELLKKNCEDFHILLNSGGNYKKQRANPGEEGLYQDASRLIKEALNSSDWSLEERVLLAETIEEWLPKVIGPWDMREQRRKLKLNKLKNM